MKPKAVAPVLEKPAPAPAEVRQKPTVIAFALVKREKAWHALALRIRGREVLEERVLAGPWDYLDWPETVAQRAMGDLAQFDMDPFLEAQP